MVVKKIYPGILKGEIDYIYSFVEDGVSGTEEHMHLPDGSFKLLFQFGEPILIKDNGIFKELPQVRVVGGHTQSFELRYPAKFIVYVVVFKPTFVTNYIRAISDVRVDKNVSAEEVFGQEILQLAGDISKSIDTESVANLIELFLLNHRVVRSNYYSQSIDYANQLIANGNISVSEISKEIGMSERNFRRRFSQLTGFSPKKMAQLKRVKNLSKLLNGQLMSQDIATHLGYYDIPHLNHDFKSVVKKTPIQYQTGLDHIDEAFNKAYCYPVSSKEL